MDDHVRIGTAASILGVSVDTLRRWETEGRVRFARSSGGQRVLDPGQLRELLRDRPRPPGVSARNHFEGTVVAVKRDEVVAQVELACGPFRVVSIVTREAVDELDLKVGDGATAVVKATNVEIRR